MNSVTAYATTSTPNGVAIEIDDPPITLDFCGIEITQKNRVRGTLTATLHDRAGDAILLRDVVTLTTAAGRAKVIADVKAKGKTLPAAVLIALEQAARQRPPTAPGASTLPRLDGAMTVLDDGNLVYLIRQDETFATVTNADVLDELQARMHYRLPKLPDVESRLSGSALATIRDGSERGGPDGVRLFEDVRTLLARYVVWPSPHVPALLAVWVIGTYCFRLFTYYPYVILGSMVKRSGKSLVLEVLSELAFNATPPQANPTAAAIYRDLDSNHATLLLDEIESLGDRNKDDAAAILAVLNVGFKNNGTVSRVEKRGDRFVPVRYTAYSPKVLAGIQRPADTIRDRAVQIRLPRKKRDDALPRFNVRKLGPQLQDIRDRLHRFALATSPDIRSLYDDAEQLILPADLDDRARDILEPLFAIAAAIDANAGMAHVTAPLTMGVHALMLDRGDDVGDEATLVRVLEVLRGSLANGTGEIVVTAAEAVPIFAKGELDWVTEPKHARVLLRKLGFVSAAHRRGGSVIRGYKIERDAVTDLWDRYGPIETPGNGPLGDEPEARENSARV